MHFLSLQNKDVIDIHTGKKIGYIVDLILDECCLKVESIIVETSPLTRLICLLKAPKKCVIPICFIKSIGEDVILVDINSI